MPTPTLGEGLGSQRNQHARSLLVALDGRRVGDMFVEDRLEAFLTSPARHRCLLLVDRDPVQLDLVAGQLTVQRAWERISMGRDLSSALMAVSSTARPRTAVQWVRRRLDPPGSTPRICCDIDILFEPSLELDPLMLLRQSTQINGIVAMWPGSYGDDVLVYATPQHAHYRTWRRPGVGVLVLSEAG